MGTLIHALTPVCVIVCATVLAALGKIDGASAIAMISAAGAIAVPAVARAHSRETSTTAPPPPGP